MTAAEERRVDLLRLVRQWEPPVIPHCSNCLYATVGGSPDAPRASCAQGWGPADIDLWRLIRPSRPRGFRSALTCPDFSSMSDEDAP